MTTSSKPKLALWFRYGPAEHAELFHALPTIVARLAEHAEVHYFGLRSRKPVPPAMALHMRVHTLPFRIDRTRTADKWCKTLLWIAAIPGLGLYCRLRGMRAVYIDETIPLVAPLARWFFGPRVAVTIADFFIDMYAGRHAVVRWLGVPVKRADWHAWKRVPLIFTRAKNTAGFLQQHGVPAERIHPVYDPCDFSRYHPIDRAAARRDWHLPPTVRVLVHHGILHPNKGNDRIIRALALHRNRFPDLHFLLIGDGPELPALKRLTRELDMEKRVTFTGWLPGIEQVNRALNAGDIGLVMRVGQPSDDFHMTGALVHSMACGLPILAARLAGIAEVVEDGRNGYLFDPRRMTEFVDKLVLLCDDPPSRERLGAQALLDARRHFDMKSVTRATVEPLLALLGSERTS